MFNWSKLLNSIGITTLLGLLIAFLTTSMTCATSRLVWLLYLKTNLENLNLLNENSLHDSSRWSEKCLDIQPNYQSKIIWKANCTWLWCCCLWFDCGFQEDRPETPDLLAYWLCKCPSQLGTFHQQHLQVPTSLLSAVLQ